MHPVGNSPTHDRRRKPKIRWTAPNFIQVLVENLHRLELATPHRARFSHRERRFFIVGLKSKQLRRVTLRLNPLSLHAMPGDYSEHHAGHRSVDVRFPGIEPFEIPLRKPRLVSREENERIVPAPLETVSRCEEILVVDLDGFRGERDVSLARYTDREAKAPKLEESLAQSMRGGSI